MNDDIKNDDLAHEYEALLQFLYLAPVGLIQATLDGDIAMMNPLAAQLLVPLQKQRPFFNLFALTEGVAPELRNLAAAFQGDSGTICNAMRFHVSSGTPGVSDAQVLEITLIKLDDKRLMAVLLDASESVRRERQLQQSEAWLNAIAANARDYALIPLSREGTVAEWNEGIGTLTGMTAAEVTGQRYTVFFADRSINPDRAADYLKEADESGWSIHEGWCHKADGGRFWSCSMIAPLDPNRDMTPAAVASLLKGSGYALIIRDISEQRAATADLLKASMQDHLTGLLNRRAFFEAAELERKRWRRAPRPLSFLAIDADYFKRINDTYGHAAGDDVLRSLAATITASAREIDVIARLGGEEFGVLLPSAGLDVATAVGERIRARVQQHLVQVDGNEIGYTVSIGVSTMTNAMRSVDDLMKAADKALYEAKRKGRNCVVIAS